MKVILLEDVKTLGKKGEMVTVNDGYARNMILPKKLGIEATTKNINDLKLQNQHSQKIAQENLDAAKVLGEEIGSKEITVTIKTGEGGKTFGSISTKEIAIAAKEQLELELDKKKMQIPDGGLKTLGIHEVKIKLHPKVTASLKVKVIEE
ncbi:MAG: 50S ribosomal protein L9 [Lachnospiraceae bacterium]